MQKKIVRKLFDEEREKTKLLNSTMTALATIFHGILPCCGSGWQCFGIGSVLDPDSIRSVDPNPYLESGSGSRRAKMTHKSIKKIRNFMY
jgi:hypothetical protein